MTGYKSKRAAAQDKLAHNDKTLQEQFDRAEENWIKANADREKFNTNQGLEDWCKAAAEFDRIKEFKEVK